ncbi:hypothetical protein KY285_035678 [Solanum tuberosum]|nr:hypothetical protein KY285_035678 [Solanum tuberosum]
MDVARELPKKIKVEGPNRRTFEQTVQYEWVPEYCPKCMQIGTNARQRKDQKQKQDQSWWLNGSRNQVGNKLEIKRGHTGGTNAGG